MSFDISEYRRVFFDIPIVFSVIIFCSFISTIGQIIRLLRLGECQPISRYLLHIFLMVLLFNQICSPLFRGGILLFSEDISSCQETAGTISCIERKGKYETLLWIDGVQYTILDEGSLSQGDRITFNYLPNSRFILEVQRC